MNNLVKVCGTKEIKEEDLKRFDHGDEYEIECPLHFGSFDYRTGDATVAPACVKLKTYPVKIEDETIYIELD